MKKPTARALPPPAVLAAFGLAGSPVALPGGQRTSDVRLLLCQAATDAAGVWLDFSASVMSALNTTSESRLFRALMDSAGRFLTFEYIGPADYFGEAPGGQRSRGAHCTSVDAAFLHRARDGAVELVLVEWKYTESYRPRQPDAAKDAERWRRYGAAWSDASGPVRSDLVEFGEVLAEPFYQLVRQQLLAHALEANRAHGAGRARVVLVLPGGNDAYQQSIHSPALQALGNTVSQAWGRLLRSPDRYMSVDSALFLDARITSREYVLRYAEDVAHNEKELKSLMLAGSALDIEDIVFTDEEFDGRVFLHDEGIELVLGSRGTGLEYPFAVSEVREVVGELEQEARRGAATT